MGSSSWPRAVAPAILLVASSVLAGLGGGAVPPAAAEAGVVLMTATGDIDGCRKGEDTAELVAKTAGPVVTVGDNGYPEADSDAFSRCYDPTWGVLKDRTRPVPGNHDYDASKAAPYFEYFGAAAGEPGRGWYSYDAGSWHVVALNSNCDDVDCDEQATWLERDLKDHPSACILAYWHHPRFTSGTSGGDSAVGAFWKVLYDHGASVVLSGHDHDYERFAPQDPSGHADPERGIRQFIIGTGGATLGSFGRTAPNSEVRNNSSYGVLELTLRPDGYDWRFVPVPGDSFTDSGSDTCRGTAPVSSAPPTTAAPAPPAGAETPAPSFEAPDVPSSTTSPAPTSPAGPPASGRRRPTAAAAPPRPAAPAARPRPAAPVVPAVSEPAPVDPVPPVTAPPPPATAPLPPPTAQFPSGAPEPVGASDDTKSLALALSGLIERAPPDRPDRRAIAFLAIILMLADGAAMAALHRRRRDHAATAYG